MLISNDHVLSLTEMIELTELHSSFITPLSDRHYLYLIASWVVN